MMKKSSSLLLLFLGIYFFCAQTLAQTFLKFDQKSYQIGKVPFSNEKHFFSFTYENVTDQTLKIEDIQTDCGCLVLDQIQQIAPKEQGTIKGYYDPYKPGKFEKNISFYVNKNGVKQSVNLEVVGFVEPYTQLPMQAFPIKNGNLRFAQKIESFGKVADTAVVKKEIEIFNPNGYPVILLDTFAAPKHLFFTLDSIFVIPAESKRTLGVYYHPELSMRFGLHLDTVSLFVTDTVHLQDSLVQIELQISSFVTHEVKAEQRNLRPALMKLESSKFSLGRFEVKESPEAVLNITNLGTEKLQIYDLFLDVGSQTDVQFPLFISPNEQIQIPIKINFVGRYGHQIRTFALFTNDHLLPTVEGQISIQYNKPK